MSRAQTEQTECRYGHPLSGDNLRIDTRGYRECIACRNRRSRDRVSQKSLRLAKEKDHSYIVLGTEDVHEARKLLPAEVARWEATHFGHWVLRRGQWRRRTEAPLPKDARPGVLFDCCLTAEGQPAFHSPVMPISDEARDAKRDPFRMPVLDRLLRKFVVDEETRCWNWTADIEPSGYGRITVLGQKRRAHRVSYEEFVGPIPDGLTIDHLCRNPICINPDHLEPVTAAENSRRRFNPPPFPITPTTEATS